MSGGDTIRTDAPAALGGMSRTTLLGSTPATEEEYHENDLNVARLWRSNAAFLRAIFHTVDDTTWVVDVLHGGLVEIEGTITALTLSKTAEGELIPQHLDVLREIEGEHLAVREGCCVYVQGEGGFIDVANEDVVRIRFSLVSEAQRFLEVAKTVFAVSPLHAPLLCAPHPHPPLSKLTLHGEFRDAPLRTPPPLQPTAHTLTLAGEAELKVSREAHSDTRLWVGSLDLNYSILPARTDLARWLPKGLDVYAVGLVGVSEDHYPDPSRLVYQIARHVGRKTYTIVALRCEPGVEACLFCLVRNTLVGRVSSPETDVVVHERSSEELAASAAGSLARFPSAGGGMLTENSLATHQESLQSPKEDSEGTPSDSDARRYAKELAPELGEEQSSAADSEREGDARNKSVAVVLRLCLEESSFCFVLVRVKVSQYDFGHEAVQLRSRLIKELMRSIRLRSCFALDTPAAGILGADVTSLHDQTFVLGSLGEEILLEVRAKRVMDDFAEGDLVLPRGGSLGQRVFCRCLPGVTNSVLGYESHVPWGTIQEGRHAVAAVYTTPLLLTFNEAFSTPSARHSFEVCEMVVEQRLSSAQSPRSSGGGGVAESRASEPSEAEETFTYTRHRAEAARSIVLSAPFGASPDDTALAAKEMEAGGDVLLFHCHTNSQAFLDHQFLRFGVSGVGAGVVPLRGVFDAVWAMRVAGGEGAPRTQTTTTSDVVTFRATLFDGTTAARVPASDATLVLKIGLRLVTDSTPLVDAELEKVDRDETIRVKLTEDMEEALHAIREQEDAEWYDIHCLGMLQDTEQDIRAILTDMAFSLFAETASRVAMLVHEEASRTTLDEVGSCLAALKTITDNALEKIHGGLAAAREEVATTEAHEWSALLREAASVTTSLQGHETRLAAMLAEEDDIRSKVMSEQNAARGWIFSHLAFVFTEVEGRDDVVHEWRSSLDCKVLQHHEQCARYTLAHSERGALWTDVLHPHGEHTRAGIASTAVLCLKAFAQAASLCVVEMEERRSVLQYLEKDRLGSIELTARAATQQHEAIWWDALLAQHNLCIDEAAARTTLVDVTLPDMLQQHFHTATDDVVRDEAHLRSEIVSLYLAEELPQRLSLSVAELHGRCAVESEWILLHDSLHIAFGEDRVEALCEEKLRVDDERHQLWLLESECGDGGDVLQGAAQEAFAAICAEWNAQTAWLHTQFAAHHAAASSQLQMNESFLREETLNTEHALHVVYLRLMLACEAEVSSRTELYASRSAFDLAVCVESAHLSRCAAEHDSDTFLTLATTWTRHATHLDNAHTLHAVDAMDLFLIEYTARTAIACDEANAWSTDGGSSCGIFDEHMLVLDAFYFAERVIAQQVVHPEETGRDGIVADEAAKWESLTESVVFPEWTCGADNGFLQTLRNVTPTMQGVVKLKTGAAQFDEHLAVLRGSFLSVYEERRRLDLSFGCTAGTVPLSDTAFTVACPGFVGSKALIMQTRTKTERDDWTASLLGHRHRAASVALQTDPLPPATPPPMDDSLREVILSEADRRYSAVVSGVVKKLETGFMQVDENQQHVEQMLLDASPRSSPRRVLPALCNMSVQTDAGLSYIDDLADVAEQALEELANTPQHTIHHDDKDDIVDIANEALLYAEQKAESLATAIKRYRSALPRHAYVALLRAANVTPSVSPVHSPTGNTPSSPPRRQLPSYSPSTGNPALDLRMRSVSASPVPLDEVPGPPEPSISRPKVDSVFYDSPQRRRSLNLASSASPARRVTPPPMSGYQGYEPRSPQSTTKHVELQLVAQSLQASRDDHLLVLRKLECLASDVIRAASESRGDIVGSLEHSVAVALNGIDASIANDDDSQELFSEAQPHSPPALHETMKQRIAHLEARLAQYEQQEATQGALGISVDDLADAVASFEDQIEGLTAEVATKENAILSLRAEMAKMRRQFQSSTRVEDLTLALAAVTTERDELSQILSEEVAKQEAYAPPLPPPPGQHDTLLAEVLQRGMQRLEDAIDNTPLGLSPNDARLSAHSIMQGGRLDALLKESSPMQGLLQRERNLRSAVHSEERACFGILLQWRTDNEHRQPASPPSIRASSPPRVTFGTAHWKDDYLGLQISQDLPQGSFVRACNVVSTAYLNNKVGTVAGGLARGSNVQDRVLVAFPPPYGEWALRRENLRVLRPQQLAMVVTPDVELLLCEQSARQAALAAETLQRLALLSYYLSARPDLLPDQLLRQTAHTQGCLLKMVATHSI